MICFGCGSFLKARTKDFSVEVYDEINGKWMNECPYCDCEDFYKEGDEYMFYST